MEPYREQQPKKFNVTADIEIMRSFNFQIMQTEGPV